MARGEAASMRFPQGDLAILSAEVYETGLSRSSTGRKAGTRKAKAPRDAENGSRKRARNQSTETSEPEDDKKRVRGRPRLDPKDETAADRRRTQIRLAQRAYRNRKDNAIQTLEKQVQQLRDTNEEMSNAFMQLHDFALSSGLLDRNPDFGSQLRATTEKFLALAREASDDDAMDHERGGSPQRNPSDSAPHNEQLDSNSSGQNSGEVTAATTPEAEPKTQLYAGLVITHELTTQEEAFTVTLPTTTLPTITLPTPTHNPPPFEILTYPTPTNASFPLPHSPWSSLPAPITYSPHETTFGRQLQRYALERALFLISLPAPPESLISHIFGFCLLFESRDDIKRRLAKAMSHNSQESLYYWEFPFFHLGGAGTHHLDAGAGTGTGIGLGGGTRRMGNQGTVDVLKPRDTAGFGAGPFVETVNDVRDRELDADMRIALPGFAGEFLDCDEAEMYLFQRGVVIPPGADYVTAEVDVGLLGGGDGEGGHVEWPVVGEPSMEGGGGLGGLSKTDVSFAAPWLAADAAELVDPSLMDGGFSQPSTNTYSTTAITAPGSSAADGSGVLPFGALLPETDATSGFGMPTTTQARQDRRRKRVVLETNILLQEMTNRAVCLGRTPGLRPISINEAFWAAVEKTSMM